MSDDERAIRDLVQTWFSASQRGDLPTVLGLMSDDVLFMTAGQEPFGKAAFAEASQAMANIRMTGTCEIRELRLLGDWAWLRNHIKVEMTPAGGATMRRSGDTLSVLRKEADGKWRLVRDANLVMPDA